MSDISKIIRKMKQQPNGMRFEEVAKVLEDNGYIMKKPKRNISQAFYKFHWGCNYYKMRESIESSLC